MSVQSESSAVQAKVIIAMRKAMKPWGSNGVQGWSGIAEWGVLVADGKNLFTQAPWVSFFPGLAVVVCGLGFSLTGDGLADLLDVKR